MFIALNNREKYNIFIKEKEAANIIRTIYISLNKHVPIVSELIITKICAAQNNIAYFCLFMDMGIPCKQILKNKKNA